MMMLALLVTSMAAATSASIGTRVVVCCRPPDRFAEYTPPSSLFARQPTLLVQEISEFPTYQRNGWDQKSMTLNFRATLNEKPASSPDPFEVWFCLVCLYM